MTTPTETTYDVPEAVAEQRRRAGPVVLVLALCGTSVSLMQTLVVPLLPDFPRLLDTTSDNASWLVTVTLLTAAVATPILSRLADMFGKRRMILVSLGMLLLGSLLGTFSDSLPVLIVARALQREPQHGIGGFGRRRRDRLLGDLLTVEVNPCGARRHP